MTAPSLPAIRELLAGVEGETWEAQSESPSMDGGNYTFRRTGKPGIIISAHMYGHGLGQARAEFIAAAPSIVAQLVGVVERVEGLAANWEGMAKGSTQYDYALRACAYKVRKALTGEGQS